MTRKFDAIVIGTGQSGPPLADRLTQEGFRTAIIERKHVGGTCVNTGCIPTKTLVASARVAHQARRAAEYGVKVGRQLSVDMKRVKARKDRISLQSRTGVTRWIKSLPTEIPRCRRRGAIGAGQGGGASPQADRHDRGRRHRLQCGDGALTRKRAAPPSRTDARDRGSLRCCHAAREVIDLAAVASAKGKSQRDQQRRGRRARRLCCTAKRCLEWLHQWEDDKRQGLCRS